MHQTLPAITLCAALSDCSPAQAPGDLCSARSTGCVISSAHPRISRLVNRTVKGPAPALLAEDATFRGEPPQSLVKVLNRLEYLARHQ